MMFRFRNQVVSISLTRRIFSVPTLASAVLAVAFLAFLVTRFDVDLGDTWSQVKSANPWYLALAFLVHYSTFLFRGARWRLLLRNVQEPDTPVPGVSGSWATWKKTLPSPCPRNCASMLLPLAGPACSQYKGPVLGPPLDSGTWSDPIRQEV